MDRTRLAIKYGALIYLQCIDGSLSTSGLEGERLFLRKPHVNASGDEELPFFSVTSGVFRIVPTRASQASRDYASTSKKHTAESSAGLTAEPVDVFNAEEVTYGQSFSLIHEASQLYVSVAHSQPSENDPDCVSVVLVSEESAMSTSCELIFVPRYKIRSDGDAVCRDDEALLRTASKTVFFHVSGPRENLDEDIDSSTFTSPAACRAPRQSIFTRTSFARRESVIPGTINGLTGLDMAEGDSARESGILDEEAPPIAPRCRSNGLNAAVVLRVEASTDTQLKSSNPALDPSQMREYINEVNGCEEGGAPFCVRRYDVGIERATLQRSQLHMPRQWVQCGTPIAIFHRERESFLSTSVSVPRPFRDSSAIHNDNPGDGKQRHRRRRTRVSDPQSSDRGSSGMTKGHSGGGGGVGATEGDNNDNESFCRTVYVGKGPTSASVMRSFPATDGEMFCVSPTMGPSTVMPGESAFDNVSLMSSKEQQLTAYATNIHGLIDAGNGVELPFPVFAPYNSDSTPGTDDGLLSHTGCPVTSQWVIEVENPVIGGPVRFGNVQYRIRHVISDKYLAVCGSAIDDLFSEYDDVSDGVSSSCLVSPDARGIAGVDIASPPTSQQAESNVVRETALCLISKPNNDRDLQRTLFSIESLFPTQCHYLIEQDCLLLKNTITGMYVSTYNTVPGPNIRLSLQWKPSMADTISVLFLTSSAQNSCQFIHDQCVWLSRYRDGMQEVSRKAAVIREQLQARSLRGDFTAIDELAHRAQERVKNAEIVAARMESPDIDEALLRMKYDYHQTPHTARAVPSLPDSYHHLKHLIELCQRSLVHLIRFCGISSETDILRRDGLPVHDHQRQLFDAQIYRLIFDVILSPFKLLGGTPREAMSLSMHRALRHSCGKVDHSLWDIGTCGLNLEATMLTVGLLSCDEVMLPMHEEIHLVNRLAFRLLRQMTRRDSAFADGWCEYIPVFLEMDGRRLHVVDTMQEMFTDNPDLPLDAVRQVSNHFIAAAKNVRRAAYIDFLGASCAFKSRGFPDRQEFVCRKLLMENPHLLAHFVVKENKLFIDLGDGTPLMEHVHFFTQYTVTKQVAFVANQIALMARLCYDGCPRICQEEVSKILSAEGVIIALKTLVWTGTERVGVPSKHDGLRANFLRLGQQVYVTTRISDPAVQLRVRTVLFGSSSLRTRGAAHEGPFSSSTSLVYNGLPDDEMIRTLKVVTLNLLRANPYFIQKDTSRTRLMRAVIGVWLRLIRYRQYTREELEAVIPLLLRLLDGRKDVVAPKLPGAVWMGEDAFSGSNEARAAISRLEVRIETVLLTRVREMICIALQCALENSVAGGADEVIVYLYHAYTGKSTTLDKPWISRARACQGKRTLKLLQDGTALLKKVVLRQEEARCFGAIGSSGGGGARRVDGYEEIPDELECYGEAGGGRGAGAVVTEEIVCRSGDIQAGAVSGGHEDSQDSDSDSACSSSVHHSRTLSSLYSSSAAGARAAAAIGAFLPDYDSEGKGKVPKIVEVVSSADIHAYLDFLTDNICSIFRPVRLIPTLLDATRYSSKPLTMQAMQLLVQLSVVKRSMAQMVLQVNMLPSAEIVRSFDKIHDVAVQLIKSYEAYPEHCPAWSMATSTVLTTLFGSFEDPDRALTPEESLKHIYSTFSVGESPVDAPFAVAESPSASALLLTPETPPTLQISVNSSRENEEGSASLPQTPLTLKTRAVQLWAKTAGATRLMMFTNAIRKRRRGLGLSEFSKVPLHLIVRSEVMAHWRIHETLLRMLPKVPPSDETFLRLMKFFHYFTLSESNAKLLRAHINVFISCLRVNQTASALCLHTIVAILGTMRDIDEFLTPELLDSFATRIDFEVSSKVPDQEFVELLSDKVFSKKSVDVVVRRRMMLTLREHKTLRYLANPHANPTSVKIRFKSALVNLVCNICGADTSVLTLAQGILPASNTCRICLKYASEDIFADRACSSQDVSNLENREILGGFKLVSPYARALVALYFTAAEGNKDELRRRHMQWSGDAQWWTLVRRFSEIQRGACDLMKRDGSHVHNSGVNVVLLYRMFFLITIPISVAAYFMNCFSAEGFHKNRDVIGDALQELCYSCADFGNCLMRFRGSLNLSVEEVVNYRRMIGIIRFRANHLDVEAMTVPARACEQCKNTLQSWLTEQQATLQAALLHEEVVNEKLCTRDANEDDIGVFDVLFKEASVSKELQEESGKSLLMNSAGAGEHGVALVRASLRAMLLGNTVIPTVAQRPSAVALIANSLLIRCAQDDTMRECVARVTAALNARLFGPRTTVGLLNLFYNALDTVLHHRKYIHASVGEIYAQAEDGISNGMFARSGEAMEQSSSADVERDGGGGAAIYDEMEGLVIGVGAGGSENPGGGSAHSPQFYHHGGSSGGTSLYAGSTLEYSLQVALNDVGMMSVCVALCGIEDDVISYSAVRLGVALLEGGNKRVQKALYQYFLAREEGFFNNMRDIIGSTLTWVKHINSEHQYYMLKRGMRGTDKHLTSVSMNVQLVDAMTPRRRDSQAASKQDNNRHIKLSGWARVRGSRRLKLMTTVFRLLQLFCEGHYAGLQNYIRVQHDNLHNTNIVHEVMTFLHEICTFITPANLRVISQGFILLTEVCQGPCRLNQEALISYDVCGMCHYVLDNLGARTHVQEAERDVLNELTPEDLSKVRLAISTTVLSLTEGCRDTDVFQRIFRQMPLSVVAKEVAMAKPTAMESILSDGVRAVTITRSDDKCVDALFNWLIFLSSIRSFAGEAELRHIDHIFSHCSELTPYLGSIEVSREEGLERVFFRIPHLCTGLPLERKEKLLWDVDRTSRATKLADFMHKSDELIFAMEQNYAFSQRIIRRTRFHIEYNPNAIILKRALQRCALMYNTYVAPYLFCNDINYYENISILIAVTSNIALVLVEGSEFRTHIMNHKEVFVATLCALQIVLCAVLFYAESVFAFPVHLYILYKNKQRYVAGSSKFNISMKEVYNNLTLHEALGSFFGWFSVYLRSSLLLFAILSFFVSPYFAAFNLMLLIYKIPTLRTFIAAITMNGKQLLLTSLLGIIMLYLFSIVGFLLFADQYRPDRESPVDDNCKTLLQCFAYILSQGLRAGGGVGDVMHPWSWNDPNMLSRLTYDMFFYALVTVVFLNIMFGIIIDTFGQMRDEKREKEADMHGTCFICALEFDVLEKISVNGFASHVEHEHNMWMYLYFMHHLRRKDPNDYTGQESYVNAKIQLNSLAFFPDENCLALEASKQVSAENDSNVNSEDDEVDKEGTMQGDRNIERSLRPSGSGAGGGVRGGGAGAGGLMVPQSHEQGTVMNLLEEVRMTKENLASFMKDISTDAAKIHAYAQQLEPPSFMGGNPENSHSVSRGTSRVGGCGAGTPQFNNLVARSSSTIQPPRSVIGLGSNYMSGSEHGSTSRVAFLAQGKSSLNASKSTVNFGAVPSGDLTSIDSHIFQLEVQLKQAKEERAAAKSMATSQHAKDSDVLEGGETWPVTGGDTLEKMRTVGDEKKNK